MPSRSEIPWERYALVSEIVRRFAESHRRLGKTALQKMVFLLQRLYGVDCGYSYTLYTYGPYCADVARDLDVVAAFGGAEVLYDWGINGYCIRPGAANAELRQGAVGFLDQIAYHLDRLILDFGRFNAKDLEARSTIVYLDQVGRSRDELVGLVYQVKPHFSLAQIQGAVDELREGGLLARSQGVSSTRSMAN